MYDINQKGGARSLSFCTEALKLWNWRKFPQHHNIGGLPSGAQNSIVDSLSHKFPQPQNSLLLLLTRCCFCYIIQYQNDIRTSPVAAGLGDHMSGQHQPQLPRNQLGRFLIIAQYDLPSVKAELTFKGGDGIDNPRLWCSHIP